MTAGEQIAGVATYGYPRARRPKVGPPKPVPTVCPVCGTDLDVTQSCPQNCLTREDQQR
ncbi:hypothetical protein [Micromonospora profundi]|uniref:hypothetical protein n=1 Tax=Micromonospora profundi TaxID=1420889 RepID=UPI0036553AF1